MDKKTFVFFPAQLHRGTVWQFIYKTQRQDGTMERHRETFDINRIKDTAEKERYAKQVLARLNKVLLPAGYPYVSAESIETAGTAIVAAYQKAVEIKSSTAKTESAMKYKSVMKIFFEFLKKEKLEHLEPKDFTKKHVVAFSDYIVTDRKCKPVTHNGYVRGVHAIWQFMVDREVVEHNIWDKAKRLKESTSERRTFTKDERTAVAKYLEQNDKWLFYWVMLQYYCFIRGTELRRLKFAHFNLAEGYIHLPKEITKNGKERYVTIPKKIEAYFTDPFFIKNDYTFYVFGKNLLPNKTQPAGRNEANRRHDKALTHLAKCGTITDTKDLSIYCWKYTGISDDINEKHIDIMDTQQQAGHATPTQTMVYLRRNHVNNAIRSTKKDIFS